MDLEIEQLARGQSGSLGGSVDQHLSGELFMGEKQNRYRDGGSWPLSNFAGNLLQTRGERKSLPEWRSYHLD